MPKEAPTSIRIQHLHGAAQSRTRKQLRLSLFPQRHASSMCTFSIKSTRNPEICQMGSEPVGYMVYTLRSSLGLKM